jgi:hypothetical protein
VRGARRPVADRGAEPRRLPLHSTKLEACAEGAEGAGAPRPPEKSRGEAPREAARAGSDQGALARGDALDDAFCESHSDALGVDSGASDESGLSARGETPWQTRHSEEASASSVASEDSSLVAGPASWAPQAASSAPPLDATISVRAGPAAGVSARVHQPASLVELCERRLVRCIRSSQDGESSLARAYASRPPALALTDLCVHPSPLAAAAALDVADLLGNEAIKQSSRRSLERLFPVLAGKEDAAALCAVLGEERVAALEKDLQHQHEARREMASRRSGTVVQPAAPAAQVAPDAQGMYPVRAGPA